LVREDRGAWIYLMSAPEHLARSSNSSSKATNHAVKLKTSGRALPEVSEVKHKVGFGLPGLKAVKPFAGCVDSIIHDFDS
jgi:hypothetical protein